MDFLTFWNHLLDDTSCRSALNRFLSKDDGVESVLVFCLWHGWAGYGRIKTAQLRSHIKTAYQHQGFTLSLKRLAATSTDTPYENDVKTLLDLSRAYEADMMVFYHIVKQAREKKQSYILADICSNLINYCRILELHCSPSKHDQLISMLAFLLPNCPEDQIKTCWMGHWTRLLRMYPHFKSIPPHTVQPV